MAVLLSALGTLLLLMAMLSYTPQDGGWSSASGASVRNAVGVLGAGVADLLVHAFGYLAYIVPFMVLLKLWLLYRRRQTASNWVWSLRLLGILYIMASACGIAELSIWDGKDLPMGAGGMLGMAVAASVGYLLGLAGTVVTLVVLMALGLMLFLEFSWLEFFEDLGERVDRFMNRRRAAAELAERRAEDADVPLFIPDNEGPMSIPVPPVVSESIMDVPVAGGRGRKPASSQSYSTPAADAPFTAFDPQPAQERFSAVDDEAPRAPVVERRSTSRHIEPGFGDLDSLLHSESADSELPIDPVANRSAPAREFVRKPERASEPKVVPIIRAEGNLRSASHYPEADSVRDDTVTARVDASTMPVMPRPVVSDPSLFRSTYQTVGQRTHGMNTVPEVSEAVDIPVLDSRPDPVWRVEPEESPVSHAQVSHTPVAPAAPAENLFTATDDEDDDILPWVSEPVSRPSSQSAPVHTAPPEPVAAPQAVAQPNVSPAAVSHAPAAASVGGFASTRPLASLPDDDDYDDLPFDLDELAHVPAASAPVAPAVPIQPLEKRDSGMSERALRDMKVGAANLSPLPSITVLDPPRKDKKGGFTEERLQELSRLLVQKLADFGVKIEVTAVAPGPVITRFEIQPAPGVKASKITNLAKDLARSLAMVSVRVVEVIPGKSVMGIEVPNEDRAVVSLFEVLSSTEFENMHSPLTLALGHDIGGSPVITDLAKMPHLLVAGTTGSGKSVGVNAMILSMLFKATPEQLRMIMVDPKMLELSVYEGIPHLLTPVITDMKEAANGLRWSVAEMERRYQLLAAVGVRNIASYNRKVQEAIDAGEPMLDPTWQLHLSYDTTPRTLKPLPYIVIVIDEFADMMMMVGKKVEELIARIAQKARAAGIHMILATQRPSVDVITGLIKANIPTRISFQVSSRIDSRTILDQGGAEQLLGHGDMLYMPPGLALPERVHGAFVDDDEVHRLVAEWKLRGEPDYLEEIVQTGEEGAAPAVGEGGDEQDELFDEAVAFVTSTGKCSTSSVQRKLRIGYNRAARLVDAMEAAGVVSAPAHNGAREVLAPPPPDLR